MSTVRTILTKRAPYDLARAAAWVGGVEFESAHREPIEVLSGSATRESRPWPRRGGNPIGCGLRVAPDRLD